jgi:hypothetical protein
MVAKSYRCPRYPKFSFSSQIVVEDGARAAIDPHLQRLVEIDPWSGCTVFPSGATCQPR